VVEGPSRSVGGRTGQRGKQRQGGSGRRRGQAAGHQGQPAPVIASKEWAVFPAVLPAELDSRQSFIGRELPPAVRAADRPSVADIPADTACTGCTATTGSRNRGSQATAAS